MEGLCDGYMMDGTVESAFCCQASSGAAASAELFGFSAEELSGLRDDDFLISVDTRDPGTADTVLSQMSSAAAASAARGNGSDMKDPELAAEADGMANWAVLDLPAAFVPRAARQCIDLGMGVMVCESLSPDVEAGLKEYASSKWIPLLGGGTQGAVIAGRPIGICPVFPQGNVSVIGQSLSANIVAAFLLEERGIGIRHILSVGRRDCFSEEGGRTMDICLDGLADDPGTDSICLVLKSGDLGIIEDTVRKASSCGKKLFLYGVGLIKSMDFEGKPTEFPSLTAMADAVAAYYGKEPCSHISDEEMDNITTIHRLKMNSAQKYLRGFFMSETMCGETAALLVPSLGTVYSNSPIRAGLLNTETRFLKENSVVDCAHVNFGLSSRSSLLATVRRNSRMVSEAYNRTVAVILADWYGVAGSTREQLNDLAESVRKCIRTAQEDARHIAVGVIVAAGSGSPIQRDEAASVLRQAGADVFFSADEAAVYTELILSHGKER